ncbi:MAG: TetR/AcrR family transcriptional regulator [Candidatus Dadabacteria bacterium]|nr:TetR/AcrR family transcriptional regulator [Candidatus Dadabacteria bacterium]NIS07385.1 TetR/AcrR family transcriptional regulator [Candidatus Dadabacteria bacterium]NIV41344.1 TetR family transcriptional regulator [Candidatus Dadabacteria bacterium]NIX14555.1 TetR family transcriptional regulator [Candidatus Dadabacteria bacterium]NIY21022.1 TetR family transcriptional regulator [Candidatus Dadabacteria bacterium]
MYIYLLTKQGENKIPKQITKLEPIENTAIKLFAKRGIKDVTIKDIASEAGCSDGALYRHYKSKEEMAWTLYKREVESFGALIKDILENKDLSNEKKIYSAIELFYDFYDKQPTKFSFILLSQYNFSRQLKVNKELNPYNIMKGCLRGMTKGKKIKDLDLLSGMVFGLILEPARMKATNELKGKLKDRTDAVYKACMSVISN